MSDQEQNQVKDEQVQAAQEQTGQTLANYSAQRMAEDIRPPTQPVL